MRCALGHSISHSRPAAVKAFESHKKRRTLQEVGRQGASPLLQTLRASTVLRAIDIDLDDVDVLSSVQFEHSEEVLCNFIVVFSIDKLIA